MKTDDCTVAAAAAAADGAGVSDADATSHRGSMQRRDEYSLR